MLIKRRSWSFTSVAALALLAGCAGTPRLGGDPTITVTDAKELPAPTTGDQAATDHPYLLGPFDKLTIDVFGIKEMANREVQVDASGRLSFPLAGVIEAAGKTPEQVQAMLQTRLRQAYVRDPQVTVNLKDTLSQFVTVEGTVAKPGLYPVLGHMTLLRAIATAQGTTEFSRFDDVVILRTVGNKQYAALYNLNAVRHGAYSDPQIYANDIVVVGDNHARRLFKDYLTSFSLLAGPLIILLQRL